MSEIKSNHTRNLRRKRPALASMGYDAIRTELWDIREACNDVRWFIEQAGETLLNALDGDSEAEWEFRMAFADLEAKADKLERILSEYCDWAGEGFGRMYDDCTVALIGNRYKLIGYDFDEEDYWYILTGIKLFKEERVW